MGKRERGGDKWRVRTKSPSEISCIWYWNGCCSRSSNRLRKKIAGRVDVAWMNATPASTSIGRNSSGCDSMHHSALKTHCPEHHFYESSIKDGLSTSFSCKGHLTSVSAPSVVCCRFGNDVWRDRALLTSHRVHLKSHILANARPHTTWGARAI